VKLWRVTYRIPYGLKVRVVQFHTCASSGQDAEAACSKFYMASPDALSVEAEIISGRYLSWLRLPCRARP
jgi:hypothetical protein